MQLMRTPLIGPYGSGALSHAAAIAAAGATAAWFHMFDPDAFQACAQHGLQPCVEFKTFRADFATHPELIPIGVDGQPIRYGRLVQGVCLSQQWFLDEIEEALRAGVTAFQPTGIWLDYLTYGGWFETAEPDLQESCFCPACVAHFCDATNIDATTPTAILAHHRAAWTAHKCRRVADLALGYADIIRAHLPTCIIGAYMCPWTPDEFDGALSRIFAQDYALLAPAIDVFTPLIYAQKSGRAAGWGADWLMAAPGFLPPNRAAQLILDALDFPANLQALTDAPDPGWGVQLFGGAQIFADPARTRLFATAIERLWER